MSFGIICRALGCRNYAEYACETALGGDTYYCSEHVIPSRRERRRLTQGDHQSAEGMKSIEDQKRIKRCDLCGKPVFDGNIDPVTNKPRHKGCVTF